MSAALRATVIIPCRGLEAGLEQNLRAMLEQDSDYELLLVTTADDASLPLLRRLVGEQPARARVVLAPAATRSSQKLANQLAALEAADPHSSFFVFVDSDGRLRRDFLRRMLAPLAEPRVGLVTGWRWYAPVRGRFWSYVRSAWNAAAMPFLVDSRHNIAFGGAMAVRREVFARAGAAALWRRAVSDGLTLARAVKLLGLEVRFAPGCIAALDDDGSFREVLEWTNRQVTISHVYMPEFWRFTALAHAAQTAVLLAAGLLGVSALGSWGLLAVSALYVGLLGANALLLMRTAADLLGSETRRQLARGWWCYLLAAPVASWLYGVNVLRSLFSRRITWRGITYEMVSPTETRVLALSGPVALGAPAEEV